MTDEEIRIFKDGDQWCALRGTDLQEGESGFEIKRLIERCEEERQQCIAQANDDLLHGRARLCRSCGAETQSIDVCPACAEALREEQAAALDERCRIHRVRHVEDLPVSVLEEMQAERGRR